MAGGPLVSEQRRNELEQAFKTFALACVAAPFVAKGMPKQEAFERAYDLFDDAHAFLRGRDQQGRE